MTVGVARAGMAVAGVTPGAPGAGVDVAPGVSDNGGVLVREVGVATGASGGGLAGGGPVAAIVTVIGAVVAPPVGSIRPQPTSSSRSKMATAGRRAWPIIG
jgi:hypothetical protein